MRKALILILLVAAVPGCRHGRPAAPELERVAVCDIEVPYSPPRPAEVRPAGPQSTWLEAKPTPAVEQRIRTMASAWSRYPEDEQRQLRQGWIRAGLDEAALFVARGQPEYWWDTSFEGRRCRALLYAVARTSDFADLVVYTCNGVIEGIHPLDPPIGCDWLAAVSDRIEGEKELFTGLSLERQWDVLRGNTAYGRSPEEVLLTWGKPNHRSKRKLQPDRKIEVWEYADGSGQTGGMEVYIRNEKVVGWKVLPLEAEAPAAAPATAEDDNPGSEVARDVAEQVVQSWLPLAAPHVTQQNSMSFSNSSTVNNVQSTVNTQNTFVNRAPPAPASCVPTGAGGCSAMGPLCCDARAICDQNSGNRCVHGLTGTCGSNRDCARGLSCKGGACMGR